MEPGDKKKTNINRPQTREEESVIVCDRDRRAGRADSDESEAVNLPDAINY